MLSYHSDAAVKNSYLARVAGHAAADEIIKGRYWEGGKGCAVGCTIHGETHQDYEHELGIPEMLAWLEDLIFEGLPSRLAKTWPERFLRAIRPGRDLSPVGWQFLHWLLTDSGLAEFDHPAVRGAVQRCADVLTPLIHGQPADITAAADAATVAWDALKRAEHSLAMAGEAASTSPISAGAIWSAESAARAAVSVQLSVTDRSASAEQAVTATSSSIAGSRSYVVISEKLLALLEAA